ncbi:MULTISPECIES: hypothetical protein [Rhizobium/Agrobacterium group]|uniref:hypothetical protein n=1 Tax=Rhizobium/Agrobacterium group TaxID=227290 RepID=UPI000B3F71DF|nr:MULTISPECIES: hypothetical protein [Rhizobium/Agrobacterium group]MCF1483513.1 hypothetical protein [Allorhizobium ampelinum]NSZ42859.1 hypothetical protein [Agrobacterium vitis]NTA26516.1 hypothetical protein [Allorhizobium ampelinum]OVE95012.1 hypothetical protein B7W85_08410 [Allorhizobium ampelinum]
MTFVIPKSISQKRALVSGSNAELKALFGWNSDAMAALYTKKADRKKLSQAAATKLNGNILSPHPEPQTPHLKNE